MIEDAAPICFREFYEQFYARDITVISTSEEVRIILQAFADYRRSINSPPYPRDGAQGDMLLGKLLYHNGAMEVAELSAASGRSTRHWQAVETAWTRYLNAVYSDEPPHSMPQRRLSITQRVKLWWRRSLVPLDPPIVLPRRAWSLVWAVDSIREELTSSAFRRNLEHDQNAPPVR